MYANTAIRPMPVHLSPKSRNSSGCRYAAPTQTKQIYRNNKKRRLLMVTVRPSCRLGQLTAQLLGSPNQIDFENQKKKNGQGNGCEHHQTKAVSLLILR